MYTVDELFADKGKWAAFSDVVFDVMGQSLKPEELKVVFLSLDKHTQATAMEWGLSDTVFKDSAYEELMKRMPQ